MPQNIQSIEDLISESLGGEVEEGSIQGKFQQKQREIKLKELEDATQSLADSQGLPYINLFGFPISPDALGLIDEKTANDLGVVCFYYDGTKIKIGAISPNDERVANLLRDLNKKYYTEGKIYLISEYSLIGVLKLYANLPVILPPIKGVSIKAEDIEKFKNEIESYQNLNEKINMVNTSDIVTLLLATALKTDSSDIHIEAEEKSIVVRLRIDGVLQEAASLEKNKWKQIISRMKLLSRVKINITDKAQDGRFTIFFGDSKIEVRSSFLPTAFGESVVMRILRAETVGLPFEELGLSPEAFEKLEREIKKPNGMILTTGPTGSGKTTTLYSVLKKLNSKESKIITIEDPIEYQLEGINQSQVTVNYTFAKALRSVVRQDPDVIMVGEIRDLETAEIAVQAALTGHLVLSTLHTNDASGVLPRLIDMGVKPYFLAPSINAVLGQRLVRKLCPNCRVEHDLDADEKQLINKILSVISPRSGLNIPKELPRIYKAGQGCEYCSGTGYKGRIGIYEIFEMSDDIKQLTSDGAPAFKILEMAIENGMITMLQDGILKCLQGITSTEEVYRVIGKFDYIDTLYNIVISKTIGRGIKITKEEAVKGDELAKDLRNINENIKNVPTKEMINLIIASAIKGNAGDIHIEPVEEVVKVRFRIDGILHDIISLSKEHYLPIISTIKSLAGFPTNIKKAIWDGRFSIIFDEERMDSRVSIISGGYGETVVIRLLTSQAKALKMEELGMRQHTLRPVIKSMKKTKGIIINTGPTGSGKTTTLYSILNQLNKPDIKIITIEDPIEYHLEGVMQTQIDEDQGYTFAAAMRSLLRQNPNIMMIGEIRDAETARVAIEASTTGHLVLSTIHANSAAGAISRFAGLGIERQMLAGSLNCSIGQRLVRRICPKCKTEDKISENLLSEVKQVLSLINSKSGVAIPTVLKFYKGQGCDYCSGLGYQGRIGIFEIIEASQAIQRLVQNNEVAEYEIEKYAQEEGSVLMIQDGILKALEGETTVEEVFRVAK
jgi:type II secretory ATPase GspE/PulE/Tfp pilus assembly ATPase PilB-like protein